jgi:hypothetical protein
MKNKKHQSAAHRLLKEIEEGVKRLRPSYPDESEDELWQRATGTLALRYRLGHWPSEAEIAADREVKKDKLFQ